MLYLFSPTFHLFLVFCSCILGGFLVSIFHLTICDFQLSLVYYPIYFVCSFTYFCLCKQSPLTTLIAYFSLIIIYCCWYTEVIPLGISLRISITFIYFLLHLSTLFFVISLFVKFGYLCKWVSEASFILNVNFHQLFGDWEHPIRWNMRKK